MQSDKRYQPSQEVPESLLQNASANTSSEFSIRGQFREGRAAYLDMSATTPLDPRVLDAMLPFQVRCYFIIWCLCVLPCCGLLSLRSRKEKSLYLLHRHLDSFVLQPYRLVRLEIRIPAHMPLGGKPNVW